MESKNNGTDNLFAKQKETQMQRRNLQILRGKGAWDKLGDWIKQITNKPLYSTGNSKYSVMAYMGIVSKREWIYVYVCN